MKQIFREGRFPSQAQLNALPCDANGFRWYLQKSPMSRTGVVAHVVASSHDSCGKPCFRTAGTVEVITPSVDLKGVNVSITCGAIQSTQTPTMWEAYDLIKANWELANS